MAMADTVHPFGRKARQLAKIDPDYCIGCGYCAQFCVMDCIYMQPDWSYIIDQEKCIGCRSCKVNCPWDAVEMYDPRAGEY